MALIRTVKSISVTFEDRTLKTVNLITNWIQKGWHNNWHLSNLLKSNERNKRCKLQKVLIKSKKSQISRDFKNFLKSGDSKTRIIELIFQSVKESQEIAIEGVL